MFPGALKGPNSKGQDVGRDMDEAPESRVVKGCRVRAVHKPLRPGHTKRRSSTVSQNLREVTAPCV